VPPPLRVLHLHCRYRERGGEDVVVDAERAALTASGADVVAHDAVNPSAAVPAARNLLMASWNPRSYMDVERAVRRHAIDVAHVHNTWFTLSPSVIEGLHRAGVPIVVTVHNFRLSCVNGLLFRDGRACTDCVGRGPWRGVLHRCYRSSALASAAVATATAVNRRLGTWTRGVDRFLVLNGLAADVLTASGVPASRVSRTANFVEDPGPRAHPASASRTIAYVGRLSQEKGVELLLRAWRAWRPAEDWTLVVAGDGPMRPQLDALADARVTFAGRLPRDEVTLLLRRARALVLPSLVFENQPMAAVEAFAAGLPVLGRGIGGTLEVVRPLGERWLVPDDTETAWTQAMDVLADDAAVADAASAARQAYEHSYTPAVAMDRLLRVYEAVRSEAQAGVT
jgi:glycosyltransferase involved in cell wall biosynthesis